MNETTQGDAPEQAANKAAVELSEWEQFKADRRAANKRLKAYLRGWTHMTPSVPAPPPEREKFDPRPKMDRRAAKALAKAADANTRQKRDEATRRVEWLFRAHLSEMPSRTRKQRRRLMAYLDRFLRRVEADGATWLSRRVYE